MPHLLRAAARAVWISATFWLLPALLCALLGVVAVGRLLRGGIGTSWRGMRMRPAERVRLERQLRTDDVPRASS